MVLINPAIAAKERGLPSAQLLESYSLGACGCHRHPQLVRECDGLSIDAESPRLDEDVFGGPGMSGAVGGDLGGVFYRVSFSATAPKRQ